MTEALKIIFAGTPEFAVPTLTALLQSSFQVCAVYTQPDRPAGRGLKLTASPIKQLAQSHHIPVYQPLYLRDEKEQQQLRNFNADVMVVVAYGLILPKAVLAIPKFGCINIHPSLLPRWRGAAPIQSTILAGDTETGVTIMQMDEGMDTGPILKKIPYPLSGTETSGELHQALAAVGAKALLDTLKELIANQLQSQPQNNQDASYSKKIEKAAGKLNWNQSAVELDRQIRAFNPWPVAFTQLKEIIIRIWRAEPLHEKTTAKPGQILRISKQGIDIATGEGIIRILELQLPGGKRLKASDFINARKDSFIPGDVFEL